MTDRRYDLVLLDALGTVLDLEPPGPLLAAALARRGVVVEEAAAHAAMVVEMTHYRAHCDAARDREALDALRDDCARIVAGELGDAAGGLPHAEVRAAMLEALRFPVFPEVPDVLAALRSDGVGLVVVSNWDVSLHEVLALTGLGAQVDAALTSAETGTPKPHPGMLRQAMALAGDVPPGRTLMVGDTPPDAAAAVAAGVDGVLVDRWGVLGGTHPTATVVADLGALPDLVAGGPPHPAGYHGSDA